MSTAQIHTSARRGSAAEMARSAIEKAEADGIERDHMLLRMTLRDASELKRDPKVATTDVSFGREGMRYLGVRVEQGGVSISTLDRGDGTPATGTAPPPPAPKKKATRKKSQAVADALVGKESPVA